LKKKKTIKKECAQLAVKKKSSKPPKIKVSFLFVLAFVFDQLLQMSISARDQVSIGRMKRRVAVAQATVTTQESTNTRLPTHSFL
jgi:hypothetical protein